MLARRLGLVPPLGAQAEKRGTVQGRGPPLDQLLVVLYLSPFHPVPPGKDLDCFRNTETPGLLFHSFVHLVKLA